MQNDKITSSIKKLPHSRVEITASIPNEIFRATREKAVAHLSEHIELPGFRKGHVPEKVIVGRVGEAAIIEEMAEITISKAYPILVQEHKLDVLGRPEINILEIKEGSPLQFTATTDIFPEISLPDYKLIATKINSKREQVDVSNDEVEKTIEEIKKVRARNLAKEAGKEFDEKAPLPELDDATIKSLGNFTDIADFRAKLSDNIREEKMRSAKDKHRIAIVEAILEKIDADLPEVIVAQEIARMEDEFAQEIERMGMRFDDYMKQVGKTRDDIQKDWRSEAEKRAKVQLMVSEIARTEHLSADDEAIEREMQKLHIMYPQAPLERIRAYVDMVLTNENVFRFLETQGDKSGDTPRR